MTALVERCPTMAAPRVTAAQVSRPMGSATTFCGRQFGQLLADLRRLDGIGDDVNILERNEGQNAIDGLLKEGAVAEQGDKLFGRAFPADRPKAFPPASGHDDDVTVILYCRCFHKIN